MIPILMYHQIGEPPARGTPYRGLTVRPSDFRRQMLWLRRLGYRGLAMRDVLPHLRGGSGEKVVGITFDDGYRNVYVNAMPILAEAGFTATNYFVARQLDGANVWDADKGAPRSPLMSLSEMRQWAEAGHEVGSHTLDHVHLPALSPELAKYQITQSKAELEQLLGFEVSAFCYPYGDESAAVRDMVRAAGYGNATTIERGLARPTDDLYGLPRVTVSGSATIFRFLRKCLSRSEDNRRRARERGQA